MAYRSRNYRSRTYSSSRRVRSKSGYGRRSARSSRQSRDVRLVIEHTTATQPAFSAGDMMSGLSAVRGKVKSQF